MFKFLRNIIFIIILLAGISYMLKNYDYEFNQKEMTQEEIDQRWEQEKKVIKEESNNLWKDFKRFIIELKEGKIKKKG